MLAGKILKYWSIFGADTLANNAAQMRGCTDPLCCAMLSKASNRRDPPIRHVGMTSVIPKYFLSEGIIMELEKIRLTEYSDKFDRYREGYLPDNTVSDKDFIKLRADRVVTSYFKYGAAKITYGDHLSDPTENGKRALCKYAETHNTEYLLDAGNYFMFEYMFPQEFKKATYYPSIPRGVQKSWEYAMWCFDQYRMTEDKKFLALGCNACMQEFVQSSFDDGYYKATSSNESSGIVGYCAKDCEV